MKKKILSAALAVVLLFAALTLASCGKTEDDVTLRVYALNGPTGMGMAKLIDDSNGGKTSNTYDFTLVSAPTQITSEVLAGRFEIAAVPVNLAATLFNKGADISLVAVNTLSVLYIVERGESISAVSDLRGKTVYATGQGSTPEYILSYLLENAGIKDEVEVIYLSDGSEVASYLLTGKADVAFIPEPSVTSVLMQDKSGEIRVALDIEEEWGKISDTPVVQGVIVASNSFINEHPKALSAFIDEYKSSVEYVNANAAEAAAMIEKYGIVAKAAIAQRALPNCNICCYTGAEAKTMTADMLKVLFDANPSSVGGALPPDTFYYGR